MSWNIHGAVGLDGRYDLDRVLEAVRRHDPDIVSLQEVDSRGEAPGERPLDRLAGALGGNVAEACTVRSPDGDYGHVLISRWPIEGCRLHDISVRRREPRAAIEATIRSPSGDIHVISVHFGLDIWERRRQALRLKALAQASRAPLRIALGDFNDWIWPEPVATTLRSVYPAVAIHRSFPARLPVFRLDRLYCAPAAALRASFVDRSAGIASDHLPLVVDLDPAAG